MRKREAEFQTFFLKWIKRYMPITAAYELKVTQTNSIPFSVLKPHQEAALKEAKHGHLAWKIPDCGFSNPFDCFSLFQVSAYVVVRYPTKNHYIIDIDVFIKERDASSRKSLTEDRAKIIQTLCFLK